MALEKDYLDLMMRAGGKPDPATAASLARSALELEEAIGKRAR